MAETYNMRNKGNEMRSEHSMGMDRNMNDLRQYVRIGDVIFVPAGTWHNVVNTENFPLRLSAVYGPPHHPRGTVHETKAEAEMEGNGH